MNSANTNSLHRNAAWRRLPVAWLEHPDALPVVFPAQRKALRQSRFRIGTAPGACISLSRPSRPFSRAFTILELMIVIGIIGLMAALALPHLSGFTKSNAMTAATRQLLDDVGLARQRALVNRSEVCMVFLPTPNFWATNSFMNPQITNLFMHQYSAYALISMRTVGDQPGKSNVHYLTDWRVLPQGIYISPFQFTNAQGLNNSIIVNTTNTTAGLYNNWYVSAFFTNVFPFPSTFNATTSSLPYIAFTPGGQLTSTFDQFILLTSGSIFYPLNSDGSPNWASPANLAETPPGNSTNNPNLIHIDWLTARAKIERNQF